jgi:hypothetical protein
MLHRSLVALVQIFFNYIRSSIYLPASSKVSAAGLIWLTLLHRTFKAPFIIRLSGVFARTARCSSDAQFGKNTVLAVDKT